MMEILPVTDRRFAEYGRVWESVDEKAVAAIAAALEEKTPLPEASDYVPDDPAISGLPEAKALAPALFGGLGVQFGWCNGHNSHLGCLEYHRSSEFNLGTTDFVLLLAKEGQIEDGWLDTGKVAAFRVPARTLVEVYATTLHYAPCQVDEGGFKVLVALPEGTNTELSGKPAGTGDASFLWAQNKWLLAHPASAEAKAGAHVGLDGADIVLPESL
jgi:hypothetical protein